MMECSYCKLDIPSDTFYTHCDYCGSRADVCPTSAWVMLKDMQQHIDWHEVITSFHVYARRVCMAWKVVRLFISYKINSRNWKQREQREQRVQQHLQQMLLKFSLIVIHCCLM